MKLKTCVIALLALISFVNLSCKRSNVGSVKNVDENESKQLMKEVEFDPTAQMVFHDQQNNYWFVSREAGVYKYDGSELTHYDKEDGLESYHVLSVQADAAGRLYFDTPADVYEFDDGQFYTLDVKEAKEGSTEWQVGSSDLWFRKGWENQGPYIYDGEYLYALTFPKSKLEDAFYQQNPNASFNPYSIYSTFQDSKGHFWFGTSNMGLYRFDGKEIAWMSEDHWTTTDEGGNFGIRSIVEDAEGFYWVCNNTFKYAIQSVENEGELNVIQTERVKGINDPPQGVQYFMSMLLDDNEDLWMVNSEGVWKHNNEELIQLPFPNPDVDFGLLSIFEDNFGTIWVSSQNAGTYRYDGFRFQKLEI